MRKKPKKARYLTVNIYRRELRPTKADRSIHYADITPHINRIVERLKISEGIVHIQIKHTTAALGWLKVQEHEAGLVEYDLPWFFRSVRRLVLRRTAFVHDRGERIAALGGREPRNAASHLYATLFPSSLTLNVHKGALDFGTWQSALIFLVDLDPGEHHPGREVSIVVERR